jgi:hypothetical protein
MVSEPPANEDKAAPDRVSERLERHELWLRYATIATVIIAVTAVATLCIQVIPHLIDLFEDDDDLAAIEGLIAVEAQAAIEHNPDLALSIFTEDATVRDAFAAQRQALDLLPPGIKTSWRGHDEIGPRYAALPEFPSLAHIEISVVFESGGASATSSTSGEIVLPDGTKMPVESVDGDLWRFVKIDGEWKIKSFTYNATLSPDAADGALP